MFVRLLKEKYPNLNIKFNRVFSPTGFSPQMWLIVDGDPVNFRYTLEMMEDMSALYGVPRNQYCPELLIMATKAIDEYLIIKEVVEQANKDANLNTDF